MDAGIGLAYMYSYLYTFWMSRSIPISEARARLPELARRVASTQGRVEYISHRDLEDDIAMISRSHLRFLEDSLRELRGRTAGAFTLSGSMATDLGEAGLDAELDALRAEATGRADAKRDGLRA